MARSFGFFMLFHLSQRVLSPEFPLKYLTKRRKIKIGNLDDTSFKGSCILRVYQVYVDSSKMIMLSVDEIMVTKLTLKKSYFDEYEEMVSDESSSKEVD